MLLDGQLVNSGSYTQNVTFTGTSTYLYADSTKANRKIAFSIAGIEYIVPSGSTVATLLISSGSKTVTITNTKAPSSFNYSNTDISSGGTYQIWDRVVYGNGIWVATSESTPTGCAVGYSTNNGQTWSVVQNPQSSGSQSGGLAFYPSTNTFVLINTGGYVYTSLNGSSWTYVTQIGGSVTDLTYGNGYLVSTHGYNINSTSLTSTVTWYSSNGGSSWTQGGAKTLNQTWISSAYGLVNNTTPTFVSIIYNAGANQANNINYSTNNGVSWTQVSTPLNTYWCSIAYGNGIFVMCSANGNTQYSSNGYTWTSGANYGPRLQGPRGLTYGGGYFVGAGYSSGSANGGSGVTGALAYSTDGVFWSYTSAYNANGTYYYSIAYGAGYFVAMPNVYNPIYGSIASTTYPVTFGIYNGPATVY